jgi:hypothetical protein
MPGFDFKKALSKQSEKGDITDLPNQAKTCFGGDKWNEERLESCKDMVKNGTSFLPGLGKVISGGIEVADKVSEGIGTVTGTSGYQWLGKAGVWASEKLDNFVNPKEVREQKPLPTIPADEKKEEEKDDPANDIVITPSGCKDEQGNEYPLDECRERARERGESSDGEAAAKPADQSSSPQQPAAESAP